MALQAASNSLAEDNSTSCSVRSYHLRSQSTLFYRNPTPAARRKVQYSSSLPFLPTTTRWQTGVCPVPVAKRRSSVWRPSLQEENQYFRAQPTYPGILEEFVQENRLPCPESPASTIKSLKSEKSLLLNLPEEGDKYKVFNVSGTLFVIDTSIFRNYPDTLLGSEKLEELYNKSRGEYFVEHYKHMFPVITRFYTHKEELVCPLCMTKPMFESCLEFYGLMPYYLGLKSGVKEPEEELIAESFAEGIYFTMVYPNYSRAASVYSVLDITVILLSTVGLIAESIPEFAANEYFVWAAYLVEAGVNVFFTLQAIILCVVYPSVKLYFSSLMSWIDIASILPFYLRILAGSYISKLGSGFRILRLIRLFRVMKLFRHSMGSQTLISFLYFSIPEILLLLLMWGMAILVFGPLIFFIEHAHGTNSFNSAFSGMWFCVVTIGTVGYGDLHPKTDLGKFLASLYTIMNLTVMTIPISIIITKYSRTMRLSNYRRI
ncbi:hypothetical protein ACHWQZ_G004627 [Mnemiopsis leidyi]